MGQFKRIFYWLAAICGIALTLWLAAYYYLHRPVDLRLSRITAGSLTTTQDKARATRELSHSETTQLSQWLEKHQDDWQINFITFAPYIQTKIQHSDGSTSSILFSKTFIVIDCKQGSYRRQIASKSLPALEDILKIKFPT
jgi:hypothetical protein